MIIGGEESWQGLWSLSGETEVLGEGRQGGHVQGHTVSQCCTDSRLDLLRKSLELILNGPFIQPTFIWCLCTRLHAGVADGSQRWA